MEGDGSFTTVVDTVESEATDAQGQAVPPAPPSKRRRINPASLSNLQQNKRCPQCGTSHGNAKKGTCQTRLPSGQLCTYEFIVKTETKRRASPVDLGETIPEGTRHLKVVQAQFQRLVHEANLMVTKHGLSVAVFVTGLVHTIHTVTPEPGNGSPVEDEVFVESDRLESHPKLKMVVLKYGTGGASREFANSFSNLRHLATTALKRLSSSEGARAPAERAEDGPCASNSTDPTFSFNPLDALLTQSAPATSSGPPSDADQDPSNAVHFSSLFDTFPHDPCSSTPASNPPIASSQPSLLQPPLPSSQPLPFPLSVPGAPSEPPLPTLPQSAAPSTSSHPHQHPQRPTPHALLDLSHPSTHTGTAQPLAPSPQNPPLAPPPLTLDSFLATINCSSYKARLQQEDVDLMALRCCSEQDLIAVGLPLGARRRIMHALKTLA